MLSKIQNYSYNKYKTQTKHKIKILGSYDSKLVNCKNNEFYDSMHPKDICMQKLVQKN